MVLALLPFSTFDLPLLPSSWSSNDPVAQVVSADTPPATTTQKAAPESDSSASNSGLAIAPDEVAASAHAIAPPIVSTPETSVHIPWSRAILCALWGIMVVGFLGLLTIHIRNARRNRHQWQLVKDHGILTLNEQLANQMGLFQPPVLFQSDACSSPVVFGAVRTSIILPSSMVSDTSLDELRLVLTHEMAHIRRWDLLGNWLSTVASTLFFFHPFVWLALRESWLEEEMACDELVMQQSDVSASAYGHLLLDLAKQFRRVELPVAAVGITESFSLLLKRRILALKTSGTRTRRILAFSWTIAIVAAIGLLPWRLVAANDAILSASSTPPRSNPAAVPQDEKGSDNNYIERTIDVETAVGPFLVSANRLRIHTGDGFHFASVPSGLPVTFTDGQSELGAEYFQPNTILDLQIKNTKNEKKQWICNAIGSVRASDAQGKVYESPEQKGFLRLHMRNVDYPEGAGHAALHLRLPPEVLKSKQLASIEGSLLVIEGNVHQMVFDQSDIAKLTKISPHSINPETRPKPPVKTYTSRSGQNSIIITDIDYASDGINVLLAMPWSPDPKWNQNLSEYQKELSKKICIANLVLQDSQGQTHTVGYNPHSEDGTKGPTISVGDGSLRTSTGTWSSMPAYACALKRSDRPMLMFHFHFDPLPGGVTIQSLTCTITEQFGKPRLVPFKLESIPLPE
jgi:beta-lactamase regulating signal transducer with metallopeptidase domain